MSDFFCVGVDIGGTNTDAVVLQGQRVLGWSKVVTTPDVTAGVKSAIDSALDDAARSLSEAKAQLCARIRRVNVGTTQFLNAVVQRRSTDLERVAVIRLCHTNTRALPPFVGFPDDLAELMRARPRYAYFARGGFEFNSAPIAPLDVQELKEFAEDIRRSSVRHVVISGVFSSLYECGKQEEEAEACVRSVYPEASITLSHRVGQMGLLERENAAIFNESVKALCHRCIRAYGRALSELQLNCPFYLTQNDGTLVSATDAMALPVCTFSSGPTNSMAGAVFLSQLENAIVVDIGGTTTDVGCVLSGFPRQASSDVKVGGVHINFRMPDVLSIGLGGGSHVHQLTNSQGAAKAMVDRKSVGYRLTSEALVFGGKTVTATDIAAAAGLAPQLIDEVGKELSQSRLAGLSKEFVTSAVDRMHEMVAEAVNYMKVSASDSETSSPIVLVGGGSILIDSSRLPRGISLVRPPHYKVANAVGAARGKVSGSVDTVIQLSSGSDEERLTCYGQMKKLAVERCIAAGADAETVEVGHVDATAMTYLPGFNFRLRVRAVGNVDESRAALLEAGDSAPSDNASPTATDTPAAVSAEVSDDKWLEGLKEVPRNLDKATGEWMLSVWDVECITVGAGILGCGGGGSPALGRLRCLQQLKAGKTIRVIPVERLGSCPHLSGRVATVGFMGAPTVILEKLVAGQELCAALHAVQKLSAAMDKPEDHRELSVLPKSSDGVMAVDKGLDDICKTSFATDEGPILGNIAALMSIEAGGLNCMEPLCLGALTGLPVVDADGMGRAFPELQMFVPIINGVDPCPCALVDASGRWKACTAVDSPGQLETFMRIAVGEFGCIAAVAFAPLLIDQVKHFTVHGSLTRSHHIGEAVLRARKTSADPVRALLQLEDARLVVKGKIFDRRIAVDGGFARGSIKVEAFINGSDSSESRIFQVDIQNEFVCVRKLIPGQRHGVVMACVPHLLTVLDCETGFPITTEELRPGQRVAVVVIHAPPQLLTPAALHVVGPQYFLKDTKEYGTVTDPIFPA